MRLTPLLHRGAACVLLAVLAGCGSEADREESSVDAAPVASAPAPVSAPPEAPDESREQRRERIVEASSPDLPQWTPELASTEQRAPQEILEVAQVAFDAGRLHGGQDNALGLYLALLEREPENPEAQAGIARVVERLHEAIEQSTASGAFDAAGVDLAVLLRLRPDDPALRTLQARLERARLIALLLQDAERLAERGQMVDPADDSAAGVYAEVLALEPEQPAALAGLARLESSLVAQATAAAEAGDYARSERLLADAARVTPGSGRVQDASTQIVELRQGRAGELLQQAHAEVAAGRLERASQLLTQLERVSAQAQGIEELRTRIEQARIYGGFAPGQSIREPLAVGGQGPELVVIPAGEFQMGSPRAEADRKKNEGPRHTVKFTRGFALGRTEITVAQFGEFVRASNYRSSAQRAGRSTIYDERTGSMAERRGVDWERDHGGRKAEPDLPVVHVSWEDARAYTDWLSREIGATYRLPSEAEFEYALRAGTTTRYPWGDADPTRVVGNLTGDKDRSATQRGWSNAFPDYDDGFWGAAPVRAYRANGFGLHDTEGNVSEWVEDCWHDTYARAPVDGSAWVNPGCARRVIRGASWASAPDQARSAFRISATPQTSNARVGFRVARDL